MCRDFIKWPRNIALCWLKLKPQSHLSQRIWESARWGREWIHFVIFTASMRPGGHSHVRVLASRNKSSFVGGYLRHGERFAAWFTGQSWTRSRTMSGDRTGEREREKKNINREGEKKWKENNRRERHWEKGKEREREREATFLIAAAEEENEVPPCIQGRERGEENVVLCSSRCRSSSPGSFLRRGQRPTKPRPRLRCRFNRV